MVSPERMQRRKPQERELQRKIEAFIIRIASGVWYSAILSRMGVGVC